MTDLRTAVQQALDALGKFSIGYHVDAVELNDLIATLDAALEQTALEAERESAAELTRVYQEGYEHGVRNALEQPEQEPLADSFTMDELTDAAVYAEIPDGPFQSLLIGLQEAIKQRAALEQPEQEPVAVPPPPKLIYTGGWWAITGARLIVETHHPAGYTTHRELANDERQKWADWFKAMKEAQ